MTTNDLMTEALVTHQTAQTGRNDADGMLFATGAFALGRGCMPRSTYSCSTGAGLALLEAVVDPEESAALWVADPNPRAQAFLCKHGFVVDHDVAGCRRRSRL